MLERSPGLPLILASSSPYRQQLLQRLGLPFHCQAPDIDETAKAGESAVALVSRLSQEKASAIARSFPQAVIIGSDQVAVLNEQVLGKPGHHAAAVAQLKAVSGKTIQFHTGLCVLNAQTGEYQLDSIPTTVQFRDLSLAEIEAYCQREQPYDCAGSFKSEGLGIILLSAVSSHDPTALIGLPLIRLSQMLTKAGIRLIGDDGAARLS